MHRGELGEHLPSACGEAQLDLAPIAVRGLARDQAFLLEPVHESHRAVVLDEELLREIVDRHALVLRASAQHEHGLIVLRREPGQSTAWFGLASLDAEPFTDADVAQLQRQLQLPQATVAARVALGFALVRALEDRADPRSALRALHKANALQQRQLNWNAMLASARVDATIQAFAKPVPAADPSLGEGVIFIVALPQSGSLLTEQILAAHPQAVAADEMGDLQQILDAESARRRQPLTQWAGSASTADWSRLGQAYLARIEGRRANASHFIDRNIDNWQAVGAALAMLPGARVVNSRRDAFESCFACYRQLFVSGHAFSYDLDHVVSYCCQGRCTFVGNSQGWTSLSLAFFQYRDDIR